MYSNIISVCVFAFALLIGSGHNNTRHFAGDKLAKEMSTWFVQQQGDGIIGDWKLALQTFDENNTKRLDVEERRKATPKSYFYRFSTDGTCLINFARQPQGAFKGHYEKKTGPGSFERIITYLDEGDAPGKESERIILSLTKDTLVLLNVSYEGTIWIFKRG